MEEVPGLEESLFALDEEPALTGQNEERLPIRLGVVNAALAGLKDGHIDPELRELDRRLAVLVGEPTRRAPRLRREPLGIAHVDDKPTLRDGRKPGASVLKPRFVHAADSRSQATVVSSVRVFGNDARARIDAMSNLFEPEWGERTTAPLRGRTARDGAAAGAYRLGATRYEVDPGQNGSAV